MIPVHPLCKCVAIPAIVGVKGNRLKQPTQNDQLIRLRVLNGSLYADDSNDGIFHHLGWIKGEQGADGKDGIGIKGERGERGASGFRGFSGTSIVGPQGPEGLAGKDGLEGLSGSIPDHEIDLAGSRFRFKKPDGTWGQWIRIPRGGGGADDWFYKKVKKNWRFAVVDGRLYAQKKVNGVWKNAGYFDYTS